MIQKSKLVLSLGVALFLVTFSLYWQTRTFEFLNYDDFDYVNNCVAVTNGLSVASVTWAFGREPCSETANWHPVTTLSWMLDVTLFGVSPGAMHLHNAVIHSVNAVLFFYFLLMLLKCMGYQGGAYENEKCKAESGKSFATSSFSLFTCLAAFMGAAFWAWHPLRAESVAWVSSRKDVLSILFLLPGLMAYLKALRGKRKIWLFVSGVCYLLAYFSKPTAVVYPILAVMTEYIVTRHISWRQNELLIYLMVVLMAVTFIVQDIGGAMGMVFPLGLRIQNAIAGLGHYVSATVWPARLSLLYKYEAPVSFTRFVAGSVFLITIFWLFLEEILPRIKRYWNGHHEAMPDGGYTIEPIMMAAYGTLWFGVSLAPVIGLIQVGVASCADRYTYLSGLGLSIMLVVAMRHLLSRIEQIEASRNRFVFHVFFFALPSLGLAIFSGLAYRYVAQWENSQKVFSHAVRVTEGNYLAYCNIGMVSLAGGRYVEALDAFLESSKFMFVELEQKRLSTPYKDTILTDLAISFSALAGEVLEKTTKGVQVKKDVVLLTKVKISDPLAVKKLFAQGLYSYWKELDSLAIQYFDEALKLAPLDDYLWRFKGYSLQRMGSNEEALTAFKRSYSLNPARDVQKRINEIEKSMVAGDGA
jgi:hypothetical protein